MATNCYEFQLPVEVCVDGPVGDGATAFMRAFVTSPGHVGISSSPVGTVSNWDGSTAVFEGWVDYLGGCTILSSTLSITLIGDDEVEVTIEIDVDDCPNPGSIYSSCNDSPGPHTFTDTKIVSMTGGGCSA